MKPSSAARRRGPPSQRWLTFLRNHAPNIAAMELFVFRPLDSTCSTSWPSSGWGAGSLSGSKSHRIQLRRGSHPRSQRHSLGMSNCVVGSGGSWLPCSTIAEHSVEGCNHFSHDGDDDDLGFFVGGGEAFVEGFEGGTVTACAEGGHVEDVTDRHPTTIDAAVSLELAAVEVIGCEADEGGDLFAAHLPEFWQQGDEREGQHRADTWHRGQQFIALSESNIGGNHLGQALVEEADIGLQSHLAAFAEPPEHGIFEMSRLVLGRNMLVTQLSPHRHDLGEPFDRSV